MASKINGRFVAPEHEVKSVARNRRGTRSFKLAQSEYALPRRMRNLGARRQASAWRAAEWALEIGCPDELTKVARAMYAYCAAQVEESAY